MFWLLIDLCYGMGFFIWVGGRMVFVWFYGLMVFVSERRVAWLMRLASRLANF
jgi:hypothetical protein